MNVPTLIIVFNREDPARKLLELLQDIKPKKLYVACDGPRAQRPGEKDKVDRVRQLVQELVTWECDVSLRYQDTNLGSAANISQALTWFFTHEPEGIILEDDCLPNKSFFPFCEKSLEKYRDDQRVASIAGCNFGLPVDGPADYTYVKTSISWGWASWRRVWQQFDPYLTTYPDMVASGKLRAAFTHLRHYLYYKHLWGLIHRKQIFSWDYSFLYLLISKNLLTVMPGKNLVRNIGFGEDAARTKTAPTQYDVDKTFEMDIDNLISPETVAANMDVTEQFYDRHAVLWRLLAVRMREKLTGKNFFNPALKDYSLSMMPKAEK